MKHWAYWGKTETQRQNHYFASRNRTPGIGETFSGNWYNLCRMGSQKPLLSDWLIKQINSRLYPGLYWINAEKTQFRIPWKHGSRQDISAEDTKIFEAWAIASGRYKPGIDSADPSIWKRNFRSALNRKRQFHRVVDSRNDSENPHLIYEIRSVGQEAGAEEESEDISPAADNTSPGFSTSSSPNLQRTLENSLSDMTILDQPSEYRGQGSLMETGMPFCSPNYSPDYAVPSSNLSQTNLTVEPLPGASEGAACALPTPVGDPNTVMPNVGEFQTQMKEFFPNGALVTEFEVTVYYRGRKVQEHIVGNTNGFRLFYNSASLSPHLQDFPLPETAATLLSDQQQIHYTDRLLERMDQGLIVEVQNTRICAQRLGRCKGFWSMTEYPTSSEPQQISNKEFTVLYDLHQFVRETEAFLQSQAGSPNYSIWLCLGELWPDPDFKPWSKKMIMVQVTPIIFKLLHELAHGVGASSLQSESINLQLSDPLSSSSFLSILEQYMDVE
ncbi:interferon regulatory factor 3 isoform X1 [Cetorhinus maximus]